MVRGFFDNGGTRAYVARTLEDLEPIEDIELVCPLPEANAEAIAHCERRADRLAVLSLPQGRGAADAGASGFAAAHHPWVRAGGELTPPGGHVAGVYASTAVWATPSGAEVRGLDDPPLERPLTDAEVMALVERRVNPLRGAQLLSANTLDPGTEWKYVRVRRMVLYLEASIDRGLQWVVFEPNGEALWARVRNDVADFLLALWRGGALQGRTPETAFFVRCDRTTMTQDELDQGRLICLVGVALVRPAEFVLLRIGQWTSDRSE